MHVALSATQMDRSTMRYKTYIHVAFFFEWQKKKALGLFVKSRHYTHVSGYNTNPIGSGLIFPVDKLTPSNNDMHCV